MLNTTLVDVHSCDSFLLLSLWQAQWRPRTLPRTCNQSCHSSTMGLEKHAAKGCALWWYILLSFSRSLSPKFSSLSLSLLLSLCLALSLSLSLTLSQITFTAHTFNLSSNTIELLAHTHTHTNQFPESAQSRVHVCDVSAWLVRSVGVVRVCM